MTCGNHLILASFCGPDTPQPAQLTNSQGVKLQKHQTLRGFRSSESEGIFISHLFVGKTLRLFPIKMWIMPLRGKYMVWAITACCCQGFLLLGYEQGVMSGIISGGQGSTYWPIIIALMTPLIKYLAEENLALCQNTSRLMVY
ncbi:hypothetical protein BDZ89DRAFT_1261599 [Hymenopellis radicata]|nr:hypothetical protein BDZ89DRAFT_1261599 [Hymenopellis radicata]